MRRWLRRVLYVVRQRDREAELAEELEVHRELKQRELERDGLSNADAALAARREIGNTTLAREDSRAVWIWPWLDRVWQDVRYGGRLLRRSPGFTAAAALTLGLGIGANTALFSVVNAVLWRPLRYPHADRLVMVGDPSLEATRFGERIWHRLFDVIGAYESRDFALTGGEHPEQVIGQRVSKSLLSLFGVRPLVGREFTADQFQPGLTQAVLISHRLWQRRFGMDPAVVGSALTLDGRSYTVVGVLPPSFTVFPETDLWTPLAFDEQRVSRSDDATVHVLARLQPAVTIVRAQRELNAATNDPARPVRLQFLRDLIVKDSRRTLWLLWGAVGFVLLIACANFANLLLARAASRRGELAVRAALGASRGRIVRQLVTESVMLSLSGGAAALIMAAAELRLFVASSARTIARVDEVVIDRPVVVFALALALLTGIVIGLVPALATRRLALTSALKSHPQHAAGFGLDPRYGARRLLIVAEFALAFVLLVGAGLLINSFWRIQRVDLGFVPGRLLAVELEFPWAKWSDVEIPLFIERVTQRLSALPAVERVGVTSSLPLTRYGGAGSFTIEGQPGLSSSWSDLPFGVPPPPPPPGVHNAPLPATGAASPGLFGFNCDVGAGFFRTMGTAVRQGREFDERDRLGSLPVAIINEAMAVRYWPDGQPLGKRLKLGTAASQMPWRTIVGVVADVKRFSLEHDAAPELYIPTSQTHESARAGLVMKGSLRVVDSKILVIRTAGRPADLIDPIQRQLWNLDSTQPIRRVATMEDLIADRTAPRRLNMQLFAVFAALALFMAAVGLYGVIAFMVEQRTHEIGIRVAMGADKWAVLRLVLGQGMKLTASGMAAGVGAALVLTRLLTSFLFGVTSSDPLTFAAVAVLLAAVAFAACCLPAWRAAAVDPIAALRCE